MTNYIPCERTATKLPANLPIAAKDATELLQLPSLPTNIDFLTWFLQLVLGRFWIQRLPSWRLKASTFFLFYLLVSSARVGGCECLQDALDLIEFVSGPAESEWGSVRNQMGRSQPWDLKYFAIGNEVSTSTHKSFS